MDTGLEDDAVEERETVEAITEAMLTGSNFVDDGVEETAAEGGTAAEGAAGVCVADDADEDGFVLDLLYRPLFLRPIVLWYFTLFFC